MKYWISHFLYRRLTKHLSACPLFRVRNVCSIKQKCSSESHRKWKASHIILMYFTSPLYSMWSCRHALRSVCHSKHKSALQRAKSCNIGALTWEDIFFLSIQINEPDNISLESGKQNVTSYRLIVTVMTLHKYLPKKMNPTYSLHSNYR